MIQRSYSKEAYQIRRMLTETTVRAADKRAQFVGQDADAEAGGVIMRDLFQNDDGGWLEDVSLLDRLVADKLKVEAETIAAVGWKWISRWTESGVWQNLFKVLADDPDNEYAMIDATIVRARQHSAGALEKGVSTKP